MTQHIVSVSSGVPSALTAILVAKKHGIGDNVHFVFADVLVEHADNYRFLDDLERLLGKSITRLSTGESPETLMTKQRVIYTQRFAPCTRQLKLEPIRDYVNALRESLPDETIVMHIGYDLSDVSKGRLAKTTSNWQSLGIEVSYPIVDALIQNPRLELATYGIQEPVTYSWGLRHANCVAMGGCVKFGKRDSVTILERLPEAYKRKERLEAKIRLQQFVRHMIRYAYLLRLNPLLALSYFLSIQLYAFLRDGADGTITLKDFRLQYEQTKTDTKQLSLFDFDLLTADCSKECSLGEVWDG